MTGLILFIRETLTNPRAVGAVMPSSKKLARNAAMLIPHDRAGTILELGAGTGSITEAILQYSSPDDSLRVIECSSKLVDHLQTRFPDLHVIHGDACQTSRLLGNNCMPIKAIVSGIPLHCLPKDSMKRFGKEIDKVLHKGGLFIQYTYNLWGTPLSPSMHLKHIYSKKVWWNVPPARINVFRYE